MDEDQNKHNPNESRIKLEGWTTSEKFDLLQALKSNGSHNVSSLLRDIPSKSREEIQTAIAYYKAKALITPAVDQKPRKKKATVRSEVSPKSSVPLFNWAKLVTDTYKFEELQTEIATALKLIAEFDNIPNAVCTDNIDFRKAYHLLASAVEGKVLIDDKLIAQLLNKCVLEAALTSRSFVRSPTLKHVLENIDISDKDVKTLSRHSIPTSNEYGAVAHLASQKNYNPLNIPEAYLKSNTL